MACILTACLVSAFPVIAADVELDLSKPVSISCDTSAVILDANPFVASKGSITIDIQLEDPSEGAGPGRWKIASAADEHNASFVGDTQESCAPDCPLTQGKDGTLQLWSPKPLALSQLDEKTALVLVTINKKSLELKASMFRNKEMAGLERGDCKLVGEAARPPEASPPVETPPSAQKQSSEGEAAAEPTKEGASSPTDDAPPATTEEPVENGAGEKPQP